MVSLSINIPPHSLPLTIHETLENTYAPVQSVLKPIRQHRPLLARHPRRLHKLRLLPPIPHRSILHPLRPFIRHTTHHHQTLHPLQKPQLFQRPLKLRVYSAPRTPALAAAPVSPQPRTVELSEETGIFVHVAPSINIVVDVP